MWTFEHSQGFLTKNMVGNSSDMKENLCKLNKSLLINQHVEQSTFCKIYEGITNQIPFFQLLECGLDAENYWN